MAQGDRMQRPSTGDEEMQDGGLGGVAGEGGATAGATTNIAESAGGGATDRMPAAGEDEDLGDDEVVPS